MKSAEKDGVVCGVVHEHTLSVGRFSVKRKLRVHEQKTKTDLCLDLVKTNRSGVVSVTASIEANRDCSLDGPKVIEGPLL